MRDGTYIIGRDDRRRGQGGPPAGAAEQRGDRRYLELPHPTVSQRHAELVVLGGRCYLTDLGSTNGTWIARAGAREAFHEGYVDPATTLVFGECPCTLAELFEANGQ